MASEDHLGHASPAWFPAPGETDTLAWVSIVLIFLALFGLVTLYAAFDRWAEHRSKGTPLAKTIPTLLTIALLYEIFPLDHFSVLLPLAAILIALVADWSRFNLRPAQGDDHGPEAARPEHPATGPAGASGRAGDA